MARKATFGLVQSEPQAEAIVSALRGSGFSGADISVLFPDESGSRDFAHEQHTRAPEGAATGAGAGGVLGGTLGLLAGIGTLAIPGRGPFIAAGPVMAALSGAAAGATLGGIAGGLIGLGIPELEARRYAGELEQGGLLVSVHVQSSEEARRARSVLEQAGATDIVSAGDSDVPAARRAHAAD